MPEGSGEATGIDTRMRSIYDELRRLAAVISRNSPHATLNPTALVNEVYLKLASSDEFAGTSTLHFKRIAGKAMRQILWDASRRKLSVKRGEGAVRVTLDEQLVQKTWTVEQLVILDELIEKLRERNARQADVVECRFYGGLTDEETAAELEVSKTTVERDWKLARAWLNSRMYE